MIKRVVLGLAIALALLGIYLVSTHLWWTENGYCWGTMIECEV